MDEIDHMESAEQEAPDQVRLTWERASVLRFSMMDAKAGGPGSIDSGYFS